MGPWGCLKDEGRVTWDLSDHQAPCPRESFVICGCFKPPILNPRNIFLCYLDHWVLGPQDPAESLPINGVGDSVMGPEHGGAYAG